MVVELPGPLSILRLVNVNSLLRLGILHARSGATSCESAGFCRYLAPVTASASTIAIGRITGMIPVRY